MSIINASTTKMEEIEIVGIPALYTPYKVSRQTVHLGMYCYELQAGPEDWGQPRRLMDEAGRGLFRYRAHPRPGGGRRRRGACHRAGGLQGRAGYRVLHPRRV